MQIKIRDLSEELDKNVKKIASKEIQKIDIFEKIIKLQDDLYQNKNDQYKAIFNKLNIIGKKSRI